VVSRNYDWAFFLAPPIVALLIGMGIAGTRFSRESFEVMGRPTTGAALLLGTIIHAHLFAVFFRSHLNPGVLRLHPWRFLLAPVALYFVVRSSPIVAVGATVLATFWDVWHSGAQTFGLARIYDRNAGNDPLVGRRLDFALNQLIYAGPILAGATMIDHFDSFRGFEQVGVAWFGRVPNFMIETHAYWTGILLGVGTLFVLAYVGWYWRQRQRGYQVSAPKVVLLASTAMCSLIAWGFDSWGEAFFIMNLIHAVQYLALVWAIEHRGLSERIGVSKLRLPKALALLAFLAIVLVYGAFAQLLDPHFESLWAITIVVSLLHFWYDGFIWSVRRAQV